MSVWSLSFLKWLESSCWFFGELKFIFEAEWPRLSEELCWVAGLEFLRGCRGRSKVFWAWSESLFLGVEPVCFLAAALDSLGGGAAAKAGDRKLTLEYRCTLAPTAPLASVLCSFAEDSSEARPLPALTIL